MSNTVRPFTLLRRRPHICDVLVPKSATTQKYRLYAAPNFDGSFVQIVEGDIGAGFLDPELVRAGKHLTLQATNNRDHVRLTFDPQSFATAAGIDDAQQFWMQFEPVDFAGTPGTKSAPTLILPEEKLRGDSRISITGTAPSGSDVSGSLTLLLPYRMQDIVVRNNENATKLYVALEAGGAETLVDKGGNELSQVTFAEGAQACLLVRGGGGTASFTASFTSFLPL